MFPKRAVNRGRVSVKNFRKNRQQEAELRIVTDTFLKRNSRREAWEMPAPAGWGAEGHVVVLSLYPGCRRGHPAVEGAWSGLRHRGRD